MTSSTCRHGAIHLRQAMKAMQPNATQIRTTTNQATAFLFSSKYFSQQSGCENVSQTQNHFVQVLVRHGLLLRQLWSTGGVLAPLSHHAVTLRGADNRN